MRALLILSSLALVTQVFGQLFDPSIKPGQTFSPQDAALYATQLKQSIIQTEKELESQRSLRAYAEQQLELFGLKQQRYGLLATEEQSLQEFTVRLRASQAAITSKTEELARLLRTFNLWDKQADYSRLIVTEPSFRLLPESKPRPAVRLPVIDSNTPKMELTTRLIGDLPLTKK